MIFLLFIVFLVTLRWSRQENPQELVEGNKCSASEIAEGALGRGGVAPWTKTKKKPG